MMNQLRLLRIVSVGLLAASCVNDSAPHPPPLLPTLGPAAAQGNPLNALSAIVSLRVRDADSVAVRFHLLGATPGRDSITSAVVPVADSAIIPVLGLVPSRDYILRPVAYRAGNEAFGETLAFTTDALPPDLPQYVAGGVDPLPGYVVFAARLYGLVIDNTGRVVWYRKFPNGPGLSFMAEPNGHYVARPTTPDPTDIDYWVEVDPVGNITRTLGCAANLEPRPHDFISEPDGSYWLLCDDLRTMNLTDYGGVADARVAGSDVQHVAKDGTLLFAWSPFDHFAITDGQPADYTGPNVNWTHGNALDLEPDGNLIVSFRNLGEVTKINTLTGAVIWRLGGRGNQFTFVDQSAAIFAGQHSVRIGGTGELLLLDNLGNPGESRGERYLLDEASYTATLTHSYSGAPGVVTQIGGSVQNLPGGRTLVSFGTAGRVEEYDASGEVEWSIQGNAGYVFRAQRIRSLYAPGVGTTR
jgi:hypothetical protein